MSSSTAPATAREETGRAAAAGAGGRTEDLLAIEPAAVAGGVAGANAGEEPGPGGEGAAGDGGKGARAEAPPARAAAVAGAGETGIESPP